MCIFQSITTHSPYQPKNHSKMACSLTNKRWLLRHFRPYSTIWIYRPSSPSIGRMKGQRDFTNIVYGTMLRKRHCPTEKQIPISLWNCLDTLVTNSTAVICFYPSLTKRLTDAQESILPLTSIATLTQRNL